MWVQSLRAFVKAWELFRMSLLVVWVPCHFLPYPPHGAYTRMYIVRLSVSQPVGTSVSQLGRFDVQRGSLYANWRLFVTPTQRSSQRLSPRRVGNCNSSTFEFTFEQRLRAQIITVIAACWSRRHPVGRSSYYYYYNCSCIFYQWIECCTHMRASRQPPLHPPWSSSVTRKT